MWRWIELAHFTCVGMFWRILLMTSSAKLDSVYEMTAWRMQSSMAGFQIWLKARPIASWLLAVKALQLSPSKMTVRSVHSNDSQPEWPLPGAHRRGLYQPKATLSDG
jgi:hypothetical protein